MASSYLSLRKGMLDKIQQGFGTFPLDNLSDAFTWIDKFEDLVAREMNQTAEYQGGVRDGEFGREGSGKLFRQLECFYYALNAYADEAVEEAKGRIDEMISDGLGDYEDEDEDVDEKQQLMDELEDVLGDLETELDHVYTETKNPDLEDCD